MKDKFFLDTNILVYAKDADAGHKKEISQSIIEKLWRENTGRISYQVLSEYMVVLTKKFKIDSNIALEEVEDLETWKPCPINQQVFNRASRIFKQYKLSWWDSLIVGAAEESKCGILYSEDLSHDTVYSTVRAINPYVV
jgi:predicted nucleic acid-binding protein